MTYARDPFDTDDPPCFCAGQDSGVALTTEEFCPACGDPAKPAPEPPTGPECLECGAPMSPAGAALGPYCSTGCREGEVVQS